MYDLVQDRFEMIKSVFLIVKINLNILRSFHCVQVLNYDPHFQDPEKLENRYLQIDRTILFR